MKKIAIAAVLFLFIVGGLHAEEPWVSVGTSATTELVLTGSLDLGQHELAVRAYAPTGASEYSDVSQPVLIVQDATQQIHIDAVKAKGWAVFRLGDTYRATWTGSTYTLDGQQIPAESYELFSRTINRLGTCSTPGAPQVMP